jgi:fructokinase
VILACGEAIMDLVSGDGIAYQARPGGAALNIAVAGARLGGNFGILARLSEDLFGRRLRSHLESEGVNLERVVKASQPTTLAFAIASMTGPAHYSFYLEGTADWQWSAAELRRPGPPVDALVVGSMALEIGPGDAIIRQMVDDEHRAGRVTIVYDPNVRVAPRETGAERVERLVPLVNVVKASQDDLTRLFPTEPVGDVARRWCRAGPQLVVVTRDRAGAEIYRDNGVHISVPTTPVAVVDSIGAGDTFVAALLVALSEHSGLGNGPSDRLRAVSDEALQASAELACRAAALTCARTGANPPTRAELERCASGPPQDQGPR